VGFFGIEIEVWQIDDYPTPAPRFNVVVRPNEWQKVVRHTGAQPPSERTQVYYEFFTDLLMRVKEANPSASKATRASYQSWFNFPTGRSGFTVAAAFGWEPELDILGILRTELYIDTGELERNKRAFDILFERKESIETEIGSPLNWQRLEDARASTAWQKRVNREGRR
jgi:hypothetical protein